MLILSKKFKSKQALSWRRHDPHTRVDGSLMLCEWFQLVLYYNQRKLREIILIVAPDAVRDLFILVVEKNWSIHLFN